MNPIRVDGASSSIEVISDIVFITILSWRSPTTAGHTLKVTDVAGNIIWDKYAIAGGSGIDYEISPNAWYNGIKVPVIDSGSLYIHIRKF